MRVLPLLALSACATAPAAPNRLAWPDWVLDGPHASEEAFLGYGAGRTDAQPGTRTATTAAVASAADLVMRELAAAVAANPELEARTRAALEAEVELVETWTSTTGRTFALARLSMEDAVAVASHANPDAAAALRTAPARHPPWPRNAPDWIHKRLTLTRTPPSIAGCGRASGIINPSLGRTTADNRARSEIAQAYEAFIAHAFASFIPAPPEPQGDEVPYYTPRRYTAQVLNSVEITGRWYDVRKNVHHSRATLLIRSWGDFARERGEHVSAEKLGELFERAFNAWLDARGEP